MQLHKNTNEIEDINRAKKGNHTSSSNLVRGNERLIFSVAIRILRNETDARTITQDTFISAYNNLSRYRGESKFSTWLIKIALNLSYGHIRKNRRYQETLMGIDSNRTDSETIVRNNPRKQLEDSEMKSIVEEKVNLLSPFHRDVIMLYYFYGYPYKDISQILNCPIGTVMSRLSNARRILKITLKHIWEGE